ncbi:Methyl-accepting chemotaxis protein [Chitinispirillum alkaliphilum]|nr:Methyl-accepting chemotaxis protein [Chitinispirillum alkaliphilum]
MGIRRKLALVISGIMILLIVVVGILTRMSQNRLLNITINNNMESIVSLVNDVLYQKALQASSVGFTIANLPVVRKSVMEMERDAVVEQIVPVYDALRAELGVSVIHIRAPYNVSFLRAHNIERYGDSTSRQAVLSATDQKKPITGFERGNYGMGMRGWVPIMDESRVIGNVETNIDFTSELLEEIKKISNVDLAVYVPGEQGYSRLTETGGFTTDVNPQLLLTAEKGMSEIWLDRDGAQVLFPVKGYEGDLLAIIRVLMDISEYNSQITSESRRLVTVMFVLGLIATIIICSLVSVLLKPVGVTTAMLKDISEGNGDLTRRLEVRSKDEIGELSGYFNKFIEKLQSLILSVTGNADTVANASSELSATSTHISANAEEIRAQTSTVASATEQATTNISSISSAAEEMSFSTNTVASAIEEMSASLNEVSRNCQKELQIAAQANVHAKNSKEVMDKLGIAAKSIGKVVEVINDIADQTNLLALNATIEAASAGEAGKGFSVVANEVKELAKQTAQATQEIEGQITDMQSNTESAVKAIEAVSMVIEEVNSISQTIVSAVEEQSATINEIAQNVSGVSAGAQEVSKNVSESATGLTEVSSTIAGVNNAVADTAKEIGQVKLRAAELAKLSENLKLLLGQFRI